MDAQVIQDRGNRVILGFSDSEPHPDHPMHQCAILPQKLSPTSRCEPYRSVAILPPHELQSNAPRSENLTQKC